VGVGEKVDAAGSSVQRPGELPAVAKLPSAQRILHATAGLSASCVLGEEASGAGVDFCLGVQVGSSVKGVVEAQGVYSLGFDANNEHVGHIGNFQHDDFVSLSQTLRSESDFDITGGGLGPNVTSSFGLVDDGSLNKVGTSSRLKRRSF
jgi:hypothetical protein